MREIYEEMARIQREGGSGALATVIGTLGSTPGKSSMKMLVRSDGSILGSVGGGCVEAEVIDRAREVARHERTERVQIDLNENDNPETGLVCGGRVEIFIEPITMPTVYLFGAGHVGRATCAVGAPAGFRFVVVDDRESFVAEERFPAAAERRSGPFEEVVAALSVDDLDYVLIMTRGHHDDLAVLRALHRSGVRPRYLGLIGSKSKWKTLRGHLEGEGVEAGFLDRVKTPIGLDIGARSAEEIAVSVMAELIQIRRLPDRASS